MPILQIRKLNFSKIGRYKVRIFNCRVPKSLYLDKSHVLSILHFAFHILEAPCGKLPNFHTAILRIAYRLKVNS